MKSKTILLLWMHIAQRNDSMLGEYISTFEENCFSPYLQFSDEEIDILKNINENYAEMINAKRNDVNVKKYIYTNSKNILFLVSISYFFP